MKKLSAQEQKIYNLLFGELTEGVVGQAEYKKLVDTRLQSLPIHMAIDAYKEYISGISRFTSQMFSVINSDSVPKELRSMVTNAVFGIERPVITIPEGGLAKQIAIVYPRFLHLPIIHREHLDEYKNLSLLSCDCCFDKFMTTCEKIQDNPEYIKAALTRADEKALERVLMRDIPWAAAGLSESAWVKIVASIIKSFLPVTILYATTPEEYTLMYEGSSQGSGIGSCMSFTNERAWARLYPKHHPSHFYACSPNIKGAFILTLDERYIRARAVLFRKDAKSPWHCGRIYCRDSGGKHAFVSGLVDAGVVVAGETAGKSSYSFADSIEPFDLPIHSHPATNNTFAMVPYFDSFQAVYGVVVEDKITVYINPPKIPAGATRLVGGGEGIMFVKSLKQAVCCCCGGTMGPRDPTLAIDAARSVCCAECGRQMGFVQATRSDGGRQMVPIAQAYICPISRRAFTTEDAMARHGGRQILRFLNDALTEIDETDDLAFGNLIHVNRQIYIVSDRDYERIIRHTGVPPGTTVFTSAQVFGSVLTVTHERMDPVVFDQPFEYQIDNNEG